MKNILIATDFSNNSYNALFYTTQLFKNHKCSFHILNAYTEYTPLKSNSQAAGRNLSLLQQLGEESLEGLKSFLHRINLDTANSKHHFGIHSKNENLIDALQQAIKETNADLVVMGNKGKTGAKSIFLASNVIKSINAIKDCPILTIPGEKEFVLPGEIAFATDYKRNYNAKLLQPLLTLATNCDSSVCIVHINEEERLNPAQKSNLYTLREYLGDIRHSIHWMPDFANKTRAITDFIDELGIDMLVMIHYQHGFLEKLTREPVLEKVSFNINIPFLILPFTD
ncbi:universal stress protein [Eudoraea sp.]|uniref:universal stress protein n=2 Tax=Eudoraea sp. TaxID=1979955 RepID=UPI003C73F1BC